MPGEEAGQATRAGLRAVRGHGVAQLVQEDRGPRLVGRQDRFGLRLDPVLGVIGTRRLEREPPLMAKLLRPSVDAGHADPKPRLRLMAGRTCRDGRHVTLAQVDRQGEGCTILLTPLNVS